MIYQYAKKTSYEFLAAGSVIYGHPRSTNFPVRLGQEIFHRCLRYRDKKNLLSIYDPCCGTGYLLTTLGILNAGLIDSISGTDINAMHLNIATKNLSLLSPEGLDGRQHELEILQQRYQKDSHLDALKSLQEIRGLVITNPKVNIYLTERNILSTSHELKKIFDLVITDVPYSQLVDWNGAGGIDEMLNNLLLNINERSIIAIVHDKKQKISNQYFRRLEKFQIGKRVVEILIKK